MVEPGAVGSMQTRHLAPVRLRSVVDHMIGSKLAEFLGLFLRGCNGYDAGAGCFSKL